MTINFFFLLGITFLAAFCQRAFGFFGYFIASFVFGLFWALLRKEQAGAQKTFWISWAFFAVVEFFWLDFASFTEVHGYLLFVLRLLFSLWCGLEFAVWTLFSLPRAYSLGRCFVLALCFAVIESLRLFVWGGLPYGQVGIAMASCLLSLQFASIGGVFILSFWLVFTNLLFFRFLCFKGGSAAAFSAFVLPLVFGACRIAAYGLDIEHADKAYFTLVKTKVYPNLSFFVHKEVKAPKEPLEQLRFYFEPLFGQKKVQERVIFPEGIFSIDIHKKSLAMADVENFLIETFPLKKIQEAKRIVENGDLISLLEACRIISILLDREIFFGGFRREQERSYNTLAYLFPGEKEEQLYDKRHLVPFAEYLPFACLQKWVQLRGVHRFFTQGEKNAPFKGSLVVAPVICFEEQFRDSFSRYLSFDPDLYLAVSDECWLDQDRFAELRFLHIKIRAVESGRSIIRLSNFGKSGVVDPLGREVALVSCEQGQEGVCFLNAAVPMYRI